MTPAKVGVILLLVQLLVPQVVYYYHSSYQDRLYLSLIGFLVGFSYSSDEGFRFALNTISGIGYSFLFLGLGFIFVYQVYRFCEGEAGRTSTLVAGLASICPILLLMTLPNLLSGLDGILQLPLPILLLTGLTAMRYVGPKEPATPWDESSN